MWPARNDEVIGDENLVLSEEPCKELTLVFSLCFPNNINVLGMDGAKELGLVRRARGVDAIGRPTPVMESGVSGCKTTT